MGHYTDLYNESLDSKKDVKIDFDNVLSNEYFNIETPGNFTGVLTEDNPKKEEEDE